MRIHASWGGRLGGGWAMKAMQDTGASPSSNTTLPGKGVRGAKWYQGRTDALIALRRHRIGEDRRRKHDQQPPRHDESPLRREKYVSATCPFRHEGVISLEATVLKDALLPADCRDEARP